MWVAACPWHKPGFVSDIKVPVKNLITLTFCVCAFAVTMCAQDAPSADLFSSDLVAWSGMQQPQPPEEHQGQQQTPNSARQSTASSNQNSDENQNSSTNGTQSSDQDAVSQNRSDAAATFTGIVSKEADDFVLKVSETTTYKLDSKQQVEQYAGQRVRVTGTIESGVNMIHVDRIEPIS